jgi:hypothetical protein
MAWTCGNYTQKHLRNAALCDDRKSSSFWGLSSSKTFTKVPIPFCNEAGLRSKLIRAICWQQDLLRAMLSCARSDPALAPLVRSHLRGVRYGISRQVQQYLEKLSVLCTKEDSHKLMDAPQNVSIDGLFQWLEAYCRIWLTAFKVCLRD